MVLLGWFTLNTLLSFKLFSAMMEWDIVFSLTCTLLNTLRTCMDLNSDVVFAFWFIRVWSSLGLYLSIIECSIAWYIIKVVLKRLILMNDELLACWIKVTNIVVGFFLAVVQSKSRFFLQNVADLSANNESSFVHGTNAR